MDPRFHFDPETHAYTLDGRRIPSATQILKIMGIIDDTYYTEESRRRGQIVHAACHYLAEGDLDWKTVHPSIEGYVRAYEAYCETTGWKPTTCETPLFHESMFYGVTPDQHDDVSLLEIKSGTLMPWTALQTAEQAMAIWPTSYIGKKRRGVELHKDGTYRAFEFNDLSDYNVAAGLVGAAWWKIKNQKVEGF